MDIKSPPYRSEKYLQFIREQPCIICGKNPCDPHHTSKAGIGIKGPDLEAVPNCYSHHHEVHLIGRFTFQQKYNVDFKDAIIRLLSLYVGGLENGGKTKNV